MGKVVHSWGTCERQAAFIRLYPSGIMRLSNLDQFLQLPVDPLEYVVDEEVVTKLDNLDLVVAGELVHRRVGLAPAHRGGCEAASSAAAPGRQGHGGVGQRNLWTLGGRANRGYLRAVTETNGKYLLNFFGYHSMFASCVFTLPSHVIIENEA